MSSPDTAARPLSPRKSRGSTAKFLAKYSMQIAILGVAFFIWIIFLIGAP